jgi:aspartyl-tRNA(Asn)/glutamyl-tRNA(Gln) amidotransferase subunit A
MMPHQLSLGELADQLSAGRLSSVELTRHYLARIERLNPALNAVITVTADDALQGAAAADLRRAAGERGPLLGIPLIHKDIFCTDGVRTSCGSRMLDNFIAPYDATVVARLRAAGAVMLGKANMDEFAMGSSNETSYYGAVRNPWDTTKVPGGSSGGSAASMAARLAAFTTGTDTGGSIRQPAALTGVTGLKPTYGRVSRYGMIAFASSLDQAGVFASSAADAASVLQVMAGFDPLDSTSVDVPVPDYAALLEAPLKGLKIGLLREFFDGLESRAAALIHDALQVYRTLGAGRVLVEPRALRRRALWPSLRQTAGPVGSVQALTRRGLRRGSQAAHHDGHLCVVRRVFRCVLFEGAAGTASHHR